MNRSFAALLLSAIVSTGPVYAEDKLSGADSYTINYKTVSILEYLQFASKICKTNFIYDEAELNFNVTVVSDEPMTEKNVMATLLQVLRIHGLTLLEQGNSLVIHKSSDVKQIAKLVTEDGTEGNAPIVTRVFRTKTAKPDSLAAIIRPMISSTAILETSPETHHLILTDITANVNKAAALIENLDSTQANFAIKSYEVINNNPETLATLASQLMMPMTQGSPFMLVPQGLSNSIFVVSSPELADQALLILKTLDTPAKNGTLVGQDGMFIYKVQGASGQTVLKSLESIVEGLGKNGLAQADLLRTVESAKWIQESNSIFFVGSSQAIAKIKEILPSIDPAECPRPDLASFFVHTPQNRTAKEIEASLLEMAVALKSKKGIDHRVIETLESVKINPATQALIFSGNSCSFPQVRELLATVDVLTAGSRVSSQFLIYKPVNVSGDQLIKSMKDVKAHLEGDGLADSGLLNALDSMKWVKSTSSLIFTGDTISLKKVEGLIATIDIPANSNRQYYVYKLQNATGDQVEDDLESLAKGLKGSDVKDAQILKVIDKMRYVKETNSLVLTGDPQAIEEVKALIAQYDSPHAKASDFLMYKPQHIEASQIEKSLKDIASNLRKSSLADPQLLQTIDGMKYVDSTHSFVFTGAPATLAKVKSLLADIDAPLSKHSPIQKVGKSTYLLYKLKNANGTQVISSLKAIAADLKKSGAQDKDFISTLTSMKYVKETNSIMFTGSEESLTKVQSLVEKFDVSGLAGSCPMGGSASNFFVYKPQSLTGPDIERTMSEFAENLKMSGLADPDLFNAIQSMRWVEKTQTLVFTGCPKALDQVKELLQTFDIPNGSLSDLGLGGPIQSIDNTSFLVYKLQFHKGDEIQGALKQISKDLALSNATISQNLLNAINSTQWIQVTNSLLFSGDQETLTRLKELVKNLDIPLKQVFIEILVLQTSLTNALNFGLEWGANYKYKNKFSGNTYNTLGTPQAPSTSTTSALNDLFTKNLSQVTSTNTPTPQMIPPPIGTFDLGVIGEVIRHNGQTYLSLGSLLNAVQTDSETSVVMMPKIITQDGKTSTLFSGSNIPFAGSFVNNTGSNATVLTANIEYRDIGFNLTVTPVLGNSDVITLDINLDSSQVIADNSGQVIQNGTSQSVVGITTSKTSMQTTVHIPNDHFLILSGMVNESDQKTKQGLPCLGGLPGIGALFSTSGDTISNVNVVIFIRPRMINSLEDMRAITGEQEDSFRDLSGTPFLQHQFDEGMELIKTADDE